ncbi:hypothetical protein [Leeuwenhoekiella sp. W20_SRS_FM14]|uniref:hypothetical protein n=1 Tax=Leeuwenhoekiella sp. W20_SRS_FM14 TaxID=3240270 RepID=UPI003F9931CC
MKLKYNISFFLIIFISTNIFSQDNRIYGNWKPFAIDNGEFYMNIETDSIDLHEELIYIENDSLKINQLKKTANQIYFKQTHTFTENGKYIQNLIVMKLELDYKIDLEKNLILASENNFLNEKDTLELPYWLKDDILYMEIPLTEPSIKLWLKK